MSQKDVLSEEQIEKRLKDKLEPYKIDDVAAILASSLPTMVTSWQRRANRTGSVLIPVKTPDPASGEGRVDKEVTEQEINFLINTYLSSGNQPKE